MVLPRLTVLDDRYAIGRVLEPPTSFVIAYQAWDLHTEDQVDLYEYFPAALATRVEGAPRVEVVDEVLFRYGCVQFVKEAEVLASLEHPRVVRTWACFEANNTAYCVMEHHTGATLTSVLEKQGGKLPSKTALSVLMPVLDGLHAAHQQGLIHGAVSPEAIFLSKTGGPVLRGFRTAHLMLARRTGDEADLVVDGYAAPEQYVANGRQGPWTDVYGWAAVFFRVLSGQVLPAALRRLEHDDVPALLREAGVFSEAVRGLLEQALALDVARRPRSVQAFQQAFLQIVRQDKKAASRPAAATPPAEVPLKEQPSEPSVDAVGEAAPVAVEPPEPAARAEEAVDVAENVQAEPSALRKPAFPGRHLDRGARSPKRKGVPVLAAVAVVVLVAFSGAYVLMQDEGSELMQYAHFKAQGDSLFGQANYAAAKAEYERAMATRPNDHYVADRLGETQQRLAEVGHVRHAHYLALGDSLYALADSLLDAGEGLDALGFFAEANKSYYEALRYHPNDSSVLEKGRLTSEGMSEALRENGREPQERTDVETEAGPDLVAVRKKLYDGFRRQGDDLFEGGDYAGAREAYKMALVHQPEDSHAQARLSAIDRLIQESDREQQFRLHIERGTLLCDQGHGAEAKVTFQRALELKPGAAEALDGIVRADSLTAAARHSDQQYQYFRGQGDALATRGSYEEALVSYRKALTFKPGDAYLQQQIEATEGSARAKELALSTPAVEDGTYKVVDESPQLIGGLEALHKRVNYPETAYQAGISGRVYVQFVVDEQGKVQDLKVVRGIGGGCDEEALRVIREARFEPGKVGGKPVKVLHTLFVTFGRSKDSE